VPLEHGALRLRRSESAIVLIGHRPGPRALPRAIALDPASETDDNQETGLTPRNRNHVTLKVCVHL